MKRRSSTDKFRVFVEVYFLVIFLSLWLGWVNEAKAQVTMTVPFVPIGIAEAPDYTASGTVEQVFVFIGFDEFGTPVYAVDSVEIANGDYGVVFENGVVNMADQTSPIETGLARFGGVYFYSYATGYAADLGTCTLLDDLGVAIQTTFNDVDVAHCMGIITGLLQYVDPGNVISTDFISCDSMGLTIDFVIQDPPYEDLPFATYVNPALCDLGDTIFPEEEAQVLSTAADTEFDYYMDRIIEQLDFIGEAVGTCEQDTDELEEGCQTSSGILTGLYEAEGDIEDVPGGTYVPPSCYGPCEYDPGEEATGGGLDCSLPENAEILACATASESELLDEMGDPSDFFFSPIEFTDLETSLAGSGIEAGSSTCPAPYETGPLALLGGQALSFDLQIVCTLADNFIRPLLNLMAWLWSVSFLYRRT